MTLHTTILIGAILAAPTWGATVAGNRELVVHEWGTFTSVAGEDGGPVKWAPLAETPDLPCFVNRLSPTTAKAANALVRMETPVLYFYAPQETTLSVHVNFPNGWITEWYPGASNVKPKEFNMPMILDYHEGQIAWDGIRVTPGPDPSFPKGQGASRYYAARATDSAALEIAGQKEKMIFYRGIGNFAIPLQARFDKDGTLSVHNTGGDPVPMAMLFENREGRIGYRMEVNFTGAKAMKPQETTSSVAEVKASLWDGLVKHGLYPREASAMIATWQDSWFEEGSRMIYIVPRGIVERELPLSVTPEANRTERVFVGRIELLSPAVRQSMERAMALGNGDSLNRLGRFLEPFLEQIRRSNPLLEGTPAAKSAILTARVKLMKESKTKCIP